MDLKNNKIYRFLSDRLLTAVIILVGLFVTFAYYQIATYGMVNLYGTSANTSTDEKHKIGTSLLVR